MRNLSSNRPFTRNVRAITVVAGSVMALATGGVLLASTASAADDPMVTLCHSTGSDSNPYVTITVAAAGAASGHYPNNTEASGNDIIPAFTYTMSDGTVTTFPAKGDQSILNNGCVVPTTITTTTVAPTTTTVAPTTTTKAPTTTTAAPTTTVAPSTSSRSTVPSNGGGSGPSASGAGVSSNGGGSGPIPTGVDSGQHTVSSWELPLGGALSAVGAAGLAGSALRKRQSR